MNYIFFTGIIGSLVLVTGAAWPDPKTIRQPVYSIKNWLFAIGGLLMLLYALFGYLQGGQLFFVILEILVAVASISMMVNLPDKIDTIVISLSAVGLIIWSLFLFEGYGTIIFILGLVGIGLGYAFEMGTLRRSVALTLGSILITIFSYLGANWIFFWLNFVFAIFSAWYVYKGLKKN